MKGIAHLMRHLHVRCRHVATGVRCSSSSSSGGAIQGVAVFGLCEDRNSSYLPGTKAAPSLILDHLNCDSSNTYSELGYDVTKHLKAVGMYHPPHADFSDATTVLPLLQHFYEHIIVHEKRIPITLGGDHSITAPVLRAIRRFQQEPITIVHFDAHPDLYPLFQDNPHSHASPFARILEQEGLCHRLMQIGIRTVNSVQRQQIDKYNVRTVEARAFPAQAADIAAIIRQCLPHDQSPVYISFDIDCIDPGMAPGVSHRESGGLTVRQVVDAIQAIPGRIVGADIVEYNPQRDIEQLTLEVATKLLKEISGAILQSHSVPKDY